MPTRSDDDRVCLPCASVGNPHRLLIEKMSRAHSFDQLDTAPAKIVCQVFFLVGIVGDPLGIG
jgi:hypothetical protein